MLFCYIFRSFLKLLQYMVYKPRLEPKPGPGLWQAFNLGLAQDFESPRPPTPGPIHHYRSSSFILMVVCQMSIAPALINLIIPYIMEILYGNLDFGGMANLSLLA